MVEEAVDPMIQMLAAGGGTTMLILELDRSALEDGIEALARSEVADARLAAVIAVAADEFDHLFRELPRHQRNSSRWTEHERRYL